MLPQPYYADDLVTLYHGDAYEIAPLIEGVDALITDPPYGMSHDTDYTRFTGGKVAPRFTYAPIEGDARDFDPTSFIGSGVSILFGANHFSDKLPTGTWLVWDKRAPSGSKGVMSDGEVAWCSKGCGVYIYSHAWDGFNRASERDLRVHPTQKPVALMRWLIDKYTKPNDLILDPFMGSGPLARAAKDLARRYVGIEIERQYLDAAVGRCRQEVLL